MLRILTSLAIVLVCVVATEIVCRLVIPAPEIANFNRANYSSLGSAGMAAGPMNASYRVISDPDGAEVIVRLNLYGFRDKTWSVARRSGERRVMFVGDSLVEGVLTTDDRTLPDGFERAARVADDPLEAMNFGIGGAQIRNYIAVLADAAPLFRPDVVVMVLFANDLPVGRYLPEWLERDFEPVRVSWATPRFLWAVHRLWSGQQVPTRWIRRPTEYAEAAPNPLNPWTKNGARYETFVDPDIATAMKSGRFNPFLTNVGATQQKRLLTPTNVKPHLVALDAFLKQHDVGLAVVYLPYSTQVSDRYLSYLQEYCEPDSVSSRLGPEYQQHARTIERATAELGIPYLDLTGRFRERERAGQPLYWEYDGHMRPEGYEYAGETIYHWWHECCEK